MHRSKLQLLNSLLRIHHSTPSARYKHSGAWQTAAAAGCVGE
jgi:hypothetical protein